MSFSYYSSEEFANDPHFREWVLNPDPSLNYFWEKWMQSHPDKKEIIEEARVLVIAFHEQESPILQESHDVVWAHIKSTIEALEEKVNGGENAKVLPLHKDFQPFRPQPTAQKFQHRKWLSVAAIIGLLAFSFFIYKIISILI